MKDKKTKTLVLSILGVMLGANAAALPILNVSSGQLVGATNVDVGGLLYNVAFVDGTCAAIFSGCDQQSDFQFGDEASANVASQALLDLVLVDGSLGNFDTDPSLTSGVDSSQAYIFTPFALTPGFSGTLFPESSAAINTNGASDRITSGGVGPVASWDMVTSPSGNAFTYALWSASTGQTPDDYYPAVLVAVPEPVTLALFGIGFAGLGFSRRKPMPGA